MKKTFLYALIGAFALGGLTETAPVRASESGPAAPRSLEQIRDSVRAEAMTSLALGETQAVVHRRWHRRRVVRRHYAPRRRYVRRNVIRSRPLAYIHRRGRWCGKYVGRRCYYTPRALRPFRHR